MNNKNKYQYQKLPGISVDDMILALQKIRYVYGNIELNECRLVQKKEALDNIPILNGFLTMTVDVCNRNPQSFSITINRP